jgi:RNA-directed DNA polymerase
VKTEVLQMVERSPLPVRQTLKELKVSSATYYRWRCRYAEKGLEGLRDLLPKARRVWNRLRDEERGFIVAYALEHPSLSPREVAARLVDREGRFVSESTVYRVLKEAGLVKPPEVQGFPAEKEYKVKTTGTNQLWHTDASYFFVVGWGYYYLITVLDDYSRMVLAWRVQPSMGSGCIIEVVQDAVEFTGLPTVPVEPGPALLTDNGPGFLSRALEEFLKVRAMKHIVASPYHPQTNGKLERYHRTAKADINLFVYQSPEALEQAMGAFVRHYNHERYHEALANVTPADVYYGRRKAILARREEVKRTTLGSRRAANLGTT